MAGLGVFVFASSKSHPLARCEQQWRLIDRWLVYKERMHPCALSLQHSLTPYHSSPNFDALFQHTHSAGTLSCVLAWLLLPLYPWLLPQPPGGPLDNYCHHMQG
jgi:hypothetical protein